MEKVTDTIASENITCRLFSVFGILLVIQAAAETPAGINFACNSVHICNCVCLFVYSVILNVGKCVRDLKGGERSRGRATSGWRLSWETDVQTVRFTWVWGRKTNRTQEACFVPFRDSLKIAGGEQLYQVGRMIKGNGELVVLDLLSNIQWARSSCYSR